MGTFKQAMIAVLAVTSLAGCATATTLIGKRNLDVQTKMSASIFLDPVGPERQTVFVQLRNTSDKPDFDIRQAVADKIAAHGWRVVNDPEQASFLLQANILQVGNVAPTAAEAALSSGYGGAIGSAVLGAGVAGVSGHGGMGMASTGLAVGAADFVGGLLVKDVYFSVITDVQISQRTSAGHVRVSGSQNLRQGTSGDDYQTYTETSNWKRYRTRVLSSANQANLEWTAAQPVLVNGLAQSISGLF